MRKKPTLIQLRKKLWRIFAKYIVLRDENICFTCGNYGNQAGHFIPKSVTGLGLYFSEDNVHCQCVRCNLFLSGNLIEYTKRIIDSYGINKFNELHYRKNEIAKWYREDYELQISIYQEKLKHV